MRAKMKLLAPTGALVMLLTSNALGEMVAKSVVGAAGAPAAGAGYAIDGTAAQAAPIGVASGGGVVLYAGYWGPRFAPPTAVEPPPAEPLTTCLQANFPNPFNPQTLIVFTLAEPGRVRLDVFDARGQLIRSLVDEVRPAGRHGEIWNGTDAAGRRVASGLYFYRLRAGDYESVKKMTVVK
jgi:hypothetical protein